MIEPRMPVYPVYPSPVIFPWTSKDLHGFSANALFMVEHTGTHMDAPLHFIERGRSIDGVRLDVFYGEAVVLRLRAGRGALITASQIESSLEKSGSEIRRGDRVLVNTGWDRFWGAPDYTTKNPALSGDAANYLLRRGVSLVGIDTPSVDSPNATDFPVHNALLFRGVPIIENLMNLRRISRSRFRLVATPLKIREGTGSPIRALAVVD